ncbi:MAG: zf-HC2 domain-containing protein [Gemmatimonadetes bacterium]|nr:zf-HC2 domain-containing protein [Gemmatimonadota bacterium]
MNCTHVKKRLTRYLERMCGNEEVAEIARHIESCPDCARELRGLQSVRGMLRCCRREKPAAVAVAEVQTAVLEGTTHAHMVPGLKRRDPAHRNHPRQYIAVAATLLLAAGGLIWESMKPVETPAVQRTLANDDMFFILQEHALIEDQSVFTSGTLGSVMVNYKE